MTLRHDHDPGDKATAGYEVGVGANAARLAGQSEGVGEAGETRLNQTLQAQVFTLPALPHVLARKSDKKSGAIVRCVNWFTLPGFLHSIITDDS